MNAIGFLETKGLTGNIEALDAMLKAAKVDFVGSVALGSGLVAEVVTGEVGDVKAAIAAGAAAAEKVGELFCTHVIPRPHPDLHQVLPLRGPAAGGKGKGAKTASVPLTGALAHQGDLGGLANPTRRGRMRTAIHGSPGSLQ